MHSGRPLTKFNKWGILILLAFIWGSSFILMKRGMFTSSGDPVYSPDELTAIRLLLAWLCLLPIVIRSRHELLGKYKGPLMMVGIFGNGIPAILFALAQSRIDSALAGMLNTLVPLFTVILGVAFFHVKIRVLQLAGIALGFAGAAGLILSNSTNGMSGDVYYALLVVLATICYAISTNTVKRYLGDLHPGKIVALALTFVVVPASLWLLGSNAIQTLIQHPAGVGSLGYIALLAIFGTSLSLIFFNRLVAGTSAIYASTVTYLIPIVAIFWGVLDGESFTYWHFGSIIVILPGISLVNKGGSKKEDKRAFEGS
jgi:drug/metabolite transporter (DMT)-like permease